jgi:hypothetical protein
VSAKRLPFAAENALVDRSRDQRVKPARFETRTGGLEEVKHVAGVARIEATGFGRNAKRDVKDPSRRAVRLLHPCRIVRGERGEFLLKKGRTLHQKVAVGHHHEMMVPRRLAQNVNGDVGPDAGRLSGAENDPWDHDAQETR